MSDGSKIQWTEATWNFVTGCTKVSDGCDNCYIERTPPFRMAGRRFDKAAIGGTTGVILHPERLGWPASWSKPRRIFVNSLADIWHDDVPTDLIAKAFAAMAAHPRHTYQVLTKRHGRMRSMLRSPGFWEAVSVELARMWRVDHVAPLRAVPEFIWIGVSVEDLAAANLRMPALADVPAITDWLSCEPITSTDLSLAAQFRRHRPRWVVFGGESGPAARATEKDDQPAPGLRPLDLGHLRALLAECREADVPAFVKQLGEPWAKSVGARHRKGGDPAEWPVDLRVRQYPKPRHFAEVVS